MRKACKKGHYCYILFLFLKYSSLIQRSPRLGKRISGPHKILSHIVPTIFGAVEGGVVTAYNTRPIMQSM